MNKLLITLLLSATTLSAHAGDTWIVANTVSHHFSEEKFNERNYGIGIEYSTSSDVLVSAGYYRNSINHSSAYVAGGYTPINFSIFHLGVFGGVVSGYDGQIVHPFLGMLAKVEVEKFGVNVMLTPKTNLSPVTMALQIKYKF